MHSTARQAGLVLAVAVLFFTSGSAALIYEVVWTRRLAVVFGHTVFSVTTVLAAYMGGLALGSLAAGRWADRTRRPLRLYAALEGGIGLYALATPALFSRADELYVTLFRGSQEGSLGEGLFRFALSSVLLVPAAALMGATLPVLSRAVVGTRLLAASRVGTLYAANTWGAVAGTALAGFFLLPAIGLRQSLHLAVGLNLVVGLLALLLERVFATASLPASDAEEPRPEVGGDAGITSSQLQVGLLAIGVSGAASMAYEIAWTRALSLALGSSTYAFTAMLTAFLAGLALGSLIVSRILRRGAAGLSAFGFVEIGVALLALAILPAFGRLPDLGLALLGRFGLTASALLGVQVGASLLVMIGPTLLIGATFPLMLSAVSRGLGRLGRDVGLVYGANTIGTILGAVTAGFLLVPTVGIQNTVRVAAALNVLAGVVVVLVAPRTGRPARMAVFGLAGLALLLGVALPHWDPKVMTSGVSVYASSYLKQGVEALRTGQRDRELLHYAEGITTTVAVERTPEGTGLSINGKVDASNSADMHTQLLIGHLPALLHPRPARVLVVGLASGVTVGAVTQHPVERVDVAELEPDMTVASRFFQRENRGAVSDPRVRILAGDGRRVLAASPAPYDVIISEPSNPWIAGVASLFTKEFFEVARSNLAPDGVFLAWLQGYGIFTRDLQMVARTILEVFPHVSVWTAAPGDYLLVSTPRPLLLDLDVVRSRLAASPAMQEDLARFGLDGEDLAYRFLLHESDLRRFSAGAPIHEDDLPTLEFSAPLALYEASSASDNERALLSHRRIERPDVAGLDPVALSGARGHIRAALAHWGSGRFEAAEAELARVGDPYSHPPETRGELVRLLFVLGRFDEAATAALPSANGAPLPAVARYSKAAEAMRPPSSRDAMNRLVTGRGLQGISLGLGDVLMQFCSERSDPDFCLLALEQYEVAARREPGLVLAWNRIGATLYQMGRLDEAAGVLRHAVDLHPNFRNSHFNLGLVEQGRGNLGEARRCFEAALRIDPSWQPARSRLEALGPG